MLSDKLKDFYRAVDGLDVPAYAGAFADDAILSFGALPNVSGRAAIEANYVRYRDEILRSLKHDFIWVHEEAQRAVLEANVLYSLRDGKSVSVPCVTTIDFDGAGKITRMTIYGDPAPLLAAIRGG